MIPLFLGLTAVNLLFLMIATVIGYAVSSGRDLATAHQIAGALAALTCCAVHCSVFTYFVATSKWIRQAVIVKNLDPQLIAPTRSFKAQAFPAALLAMAVVFVTALAGAAIFSYQVSAIYHHALAIASLVVNVGVAIVEFRAISRNGRLIDDILTRITPAAQV